MAVRLSPHLLDYMKETTGSCWIALDLDGDTVTARSALVRAKAALADPGIMSRRSIWGFGGLALSQRRTRRG